MKIDLIGDDIYYNNILVAKLITDDVPASTAGKFRDFISFFLIRQDDSFIEKLKDKIDDIEGYAFSLRSICYELNNSIDEYEEYLD